MGASQSEIVTVSSKGWVVIPSLLRKKVGIKPGMKIKVTQTGGRIVLTPQVVDPVEELYGKLGKGKSLTESLLAERDLDKKREQGKIYTR